MKYWNEGRYFEVDEINLDGAIVNVNGTSITDLEFMGDIMHSDMYGNGYTVFVDSDELWFETFTKAYEFAMNEQKDTCRLGG